MRGRRSGGEPYHRSVLPGSGPRSTLPRRRGPAGRRLIAVLATILVGAVLAGCGQPFDPSGPCSADGSAPGAYPELEAVVPTSWSGTAPKQLDSGRACTASGLGTLAGRGVTELRFAGATWETGDDSGLSLAVFRSAAGPALEPAWLVEFYESGARGGRKVDSITVSDYQVSDGVPGRRIDVLNGESYQSIVVWQRDGFVAAALVGDFIREIQTKERHEGIVRSAVDAFGG